MLSMSKIDKSSYIGLCFFFVTFDFSTAHCEELIKEACTADFHLMHKRAAIKLSYHLIIFYLKILTFSQTAVKNSMTLQSWFLRSQKIKIAMNVYFLQLTFLLLTYWSIYGVVSSRVNWFAPNSSTRVKRFKTSVKRQLFKLVSTFSMRDLKPRIMKL